MAVDRIREDTIDDVEMLFHWHRYLLASQLVEGGIVLDIACGTGYGAYLLSEKATKVYAFDIDYEAIHWAKTKYQRENLFYGVESALALPLPDHSVDFVISFETIEHLNEADQIVYMREIKRVLKEDGILLISTPDRNRTRLFQDGNPYHLRELEEREFINLLKQDFSNVELYYQEINMGSYVWRAVPHIDFQEITEFRISRRDRMITPTGDPIGLHLYMIAVCSNRPHSYRLDSVCHEIGRIPLEKVWSQNQRLSLQIKETEDALKQMKTQYEEIVKELEKEREEHKVDLERLEHLKRRLSFFITECRGIRQREEAFEREKRSILQTLNEVRHEKDLLREELDTINRMRSFRMARFYQRMMDRTVVGWFLRKLRDPILFIAKKLRGGSR